MKENGQQSLGVLLQILQESLIKKSDILSQIEEKSKEQSAMVGRPDVTLEELDANMDEKAALIDSINKLDGGFEALYDNIRKELLEHKDEHKTEISRIQELIAEVMGKSASIEALEARNKTAIEDYFRKQRKELQHKKSASTVARRYYTTANKIDYINPQFMDQKK